jgi:hypothetical protein
VRQTRLSHKRSSNSSKPPEGQILKVSNQWDGLSSVRLDNGIPHTLTLITRTEVLADLLGTDLAEIRAHLMTRQPGHFRRKTVTEL